jgi:hypothetical protein
VETKEQGCHVGGEGVGARRVRAWLGRWHAEGAARRWPVSSSSARAAARGGSGTTVANKFELNSGGCVGRERHSGGGREATLRRESHLRRKML